jgi:hypothetical protein
MENSKKTGSQAAAGSHTGIFGFASEKSANPLGMNPNLQ